VQEISRRIEKELTVPKGYQVVYGGQYENLARAGKGLLLTIPLTIVLVFMVLFILFGNLRHTAVTFSCILFALAGGIVALLIRGYNFNVSAGVGFVSIFGISVMAGIVLVSALHLLRIQVLLEWELLLVFCLGLVHGLGFASAMRIEGAGQLIALSPYPATSIVSFNLGIEAGQCVVALALYALVQALSRFFPSKSYAVWQRMAGVLSLLVGTFWLIERVVLGA
jgi:hypothetical protein